MSGYNRFSGYQTRPLQTSTVTVSGAAAGEATQQAGGDVQISLSLSNVFSSPGTYGGSSDIPVLTINAAGQITDVTTVPPKAISTAPPPPTGLLASEDLAAGSFVNIWDNGGAAAVRLAQVTDDTKEADGFVTVGVVMGDPAVVYLSGAYNDALTGLTPGGMCFLAAGGTVTQTLPSSGWVQLLGRAVTAAALAFNYQGGTLL